MSAKWSDQDFKGTVADADVLLIIDSEAGPVDNKQVLFSTLALASQSPLRANIDAADFDITNLGNVTFKETQTITSDPTDWIFDTVSASDIIFRSAGVDYIQLDNAQLSINLSQPVDGNDQDWLNIRSILLNEYSDFTETAGDPGPPNVDIGRLYTDDDGGVTTLYFQDSTGTITNLLAGGGGGASWIPATREFFISQGDSPYFFDIHGDTDDNTENDDMRHYVPHDMTLSGFSVFVLENDMDASLTVTLRVNGSDTALTVLIPASTIGLFTVQSDVAVLQDDYVTVGTVEGGGGTLGEVQFRLDIGING